MLARVRDDLDVEAALVEARHGQTDAVDRHAALADEECREGRRKADGQPEALAFGAGLLDHPHTIDVPEHEVPAQAGIGAQRPFEIDALTAGQRARAW